jgi:creatinine amidohydrolase
MPARNCGTGRGTPARRRVARRPVAQLVRSRAANVRDPRGSAIRHVGCSVAPQGSRSGTVALLSESLADIIAEHTGSPPREWSAMTWPQVQAMRDGGTDLCLLPLGATEQHGPHLPLNTDSVFATAFCAYASGKTGVPVLPTVEYGCSLGHTDRWPGTISLFPETLSLTVREIAGFLIRTGLRRLLIVNSHWGNTASLRCAIDRIRFEHAARFQIGLRNTFEITESVRARFTDDGEDFHANRAETALMMYLRPDLVRRGEIRDDPDRTAGKVFTYVVPQTSSNGLTGHPSRATAADGKKLFVEIGEALSALVATARVEEPPLQWAAPSTRSPEFA